MGQDSSKEPPLDAKPPPRDLERSALGEGAGLVPRSPAMYQRLFELMPGSVLLMDAHAVVVDCNPAFCRQIGYAREELLGRHVSFFTKDSRETIERNLARLLAGEVLEHEVTNIHKDGSPRH